MRILIGLILTLATQAYAQPLSFTRGSNSHWPTSYQGVSCPMIQSMMDEVFYYHDHRRQHLALLRHRTLNTKDSLQLVKDLEEAANVSEFTKSFISIEVDLPTEATDGVSFINSVDGHIPMHKSSGGELPSVNSKWDISNSKLNLKVNLFDICVLQEVPVTTYHFCVHPEAPEAWLRWLNLFDARPGLLAHDCENTKTYKLNLRSLAPRRPNRGIQR